MISDRASADSIPTFRKDAAHSGLSGVHSRLVRDRLLAWISDPPRPLDIGCNDDALARELTGRGCRVVQILADPDQAPARADPNTQRFDAVIAIDRLGRMRDPEAFLKALRPAMKPRSRLVVTVPNAAHGRVREALANGLTPYDPSGPLDPGQVRLFTRDSLVATIEAAGFAVGQIEAINVRGSKGSRGNVLDDPSEALVDGWLIVAHALPADDLQWVQSRLREAAQGREKAERRAAELEELHAEVLIMLDAAHRRARDVNQHLQSARLCLKDAQTQLVQRDEQHRATCRELLDARDAAEASRAADQTHLAALREALEAWHARSEAEFEESKRSLVAERDHALQRAFAAEAHCQALELRSQPTVMEWPRRALRKLKQWVRALGS